MNREPNSNSAADPPALLERATEFHRAGDLPAASELYQRVLEALPRHPVALFRLGLLELQAGAPAAALALIDRALAERADDAVFHSGRSQVLKALGSEQRLHGDLAAAERSYHAVLERAPEDVSTLCDLGTLLLERGDLEAAQSFLQRAHALQPRSTLIGVNLAIVLCRQRRYTEAEAVLRGPFDDETYRAAIEFQLGIVLEGLGRVREAAQAYRRVIEFAPQHIDAHNNLGNCLRELGEFREAVLTYEAALALGRALPAGQVASQSAVVLNNLGCLLRTLGRLDEAEERLRLAIDLDPSRATLHNNLGNVLKDGGDLDAAMDSYRRARELDPGDPGAQANLAYALSFQSDDPGEILRECWRWNEYFARPLSMAIAPHLNDRSPERRLRIGYVSPDFRDHCQALFMLPVLAHHDHRAFEIYGYSSVVRPDAVTKRIAGAVDVWREVRTLDDSELCSRVREDRIDILVDLTMHMADGRPQLFARKPAPIQVAWLAYPGTTGLDTIDYRLSDPRLDPLGAAGPYSEKTAWLPDAFWVYDPLTQLPPVNALPAESRGYVTFGCLNNPCKVTSATLRLWSRVLLAVADSRLLLLAPSGAARERLLAKLERLGIARGRVSFVPYRPRAEYLASYHEIDLGLDTLPYNGHTTSLDSTWMGVPVISRVGSTCVGRGGLSQLFQLGLLELATDTDDGFVEAAVALASDLPRLAALRSELRQRLEHSALMDAERFTRHLEQFFRSAWQDYCGAA